MVKPEFVVNDMYCFNWPLLCQEDLKLNPGLENEKMLSHYCEEARLDHMSDLPVIIHDTILHGRTDLTEEEQLVLDEVGIDKSATFDITPLNVQPFSSTTNKTLKLDEAAKHRFEGIANHHSFALPPPITFLSVGSVLHSSPTTKYIISRGKYKVSNVQRTCVFKARNDNILFCDDRLTLGTEHAFMRQDNKKSSKLVYSAKRKSLYDVRYLKNTKIIICDNFNSEDYGYSSSKRRKFDDMVIAEIKKQMPEIITELGGDLTKIDGKTPVASNNTSRISLPFIMLQHRYNKSMPWMTVEMWRSAKDTITSCFNTLNNYTYTINDKIPYEQRMRKMKAAWLKKFHRIFKKHTNLSGLVEALYQEKCFGQSVTIFLAFDAENSALLHNLLSTHKYPQNLYNFMINVAKKKVKSNDNNVKMYRLVKVFNDVRNYGEGNAVLNAWVKLSTRLFNNNKDIAAWGCFRDTMRLADLYGVRIRINKIGSHNELKELHDKLSAYARRDVVVKERNYTITHFEHPKKEYNGFKFEFISSAEQLTIEGTTMRNCSAGYALACSNGTSIIFVMKKGNTTYCMLELNGQSTQVPIVQEKTLYNIPINEETRKTISEWHKDLIEMHKDDGRSHYDVSSSARAWEDVLTPAYPVPNAYPVTAPGGVVAIPNFATGGEPPLNAVPNYAQPPNLAPQRISNN